jgi:hypothetical protein
MNKTVTPKCTHSFVGISLTEKSGKIKPCCRYKNTNVTETIFDYETLNNIHNNEFFKNLQSQLDNNEQHLACSKCWIQESAGIQSRRQFTNTFFDKPGLLKKTEIQDMEISLDYTCNMMCRMCNPDASSKWGAARSVLTAFNDLGIEISTSDISYKTYQDHFFKLFSNTSLAHLRHLKLEGGEPFYSKHLEWFIEKLDIEVIEKDRMHLNIITNGSIFPNENILKKLSKFDTKITFSLDAIGELANVIRWGVNWNDIEKSIKSWAEFAKISRIQLQASPTLSILNLNKTAELESFCESMNIAVHYNELYSPNYLSMYQLPLGIRKNWERIETNTNFNNLLLADITSIPEFNKLMRSIEILDNYQCTSFENANPEIYSMIRDNT